MKKKACGLLALLLVLAMSLPMAAQAAGPETMNAAGAIQYSNVKETVQAYYGLHSRFYDSDAESDYGFEMAGVTYTDAYLLTMGYTGSSDGEDASLYFNVNSEYEKMSFEIGYVEGDDRSCTVTVWLDGKRTEEFTVAATDLPEKVELDLTDVDQVRITTNSGGYDKTYYGVGNIQLTAPGEVPQREAIESNIVYNCEPYKTDGVTLFGKQDNETLDITGRTYTDAYQFATGYIGTSNPYMLINLGGHYESVTFDVGYVSGSPRSCTVTIEVDGETVITDTVPQTDLAHSYEVDLTDAKQLGIYLHSGGYDQSRHGVGGFQFVSDGQVYDIALEEESVKLESPYLDKQIVSHIYPIDAENQEIIWTSSDPTVAAVSQTGKVIAFSDGTANITAMTADGGYTASCEVSVKMPSVSFVDVPKDCYFYNPVVWASANNVTQGYTKELFMPNDPCTRGQVVTFIWRALGSPKPTEMSDFADVPDHAYYAKAVAWAVENGVTNGYPDGFRPEQVCTRGEVVTFLWRAANKPASSSANIFTDVAAGEFFENAVLWAVDEGITTGYTGNTFAPYLSCNRDQIVTFIYRYMNKVCSW